MLVDNMPAGDGAQTFEQAAEWAQSVLASNLPVLDSEDALMERGGVFALMGPTGVGKTTTTAKLAARCVMRFGASKVALLTTDSYRIGGHEQLRIFGKILGVPVHAVKDAGDLALALSELRNKHIVLIDTIGMSQRDRAVSDQIAMLHGANAPVQRLLLLNATSHGDTLNEVVQAYRSAGEHPDLRLHPHEARRGDPPRRRARHGDPLQAADPLRVDRPEGAGEPVRRVDQIPAEERVLCTA